MSAELMRIVTIIFAVAVLSSCGGEEHAVPSTDEPAGALTQPQVEVAEAETQASEVSEGIRTESLLKPGLEATPKPDGEGSPTSESESLLEAGGEKAGRISFSAHGRYLIQVGAYQDRVKAERLAEDLRLMGYPGGVVPGDGVYRVRIGFFEKVSEAEELGERLTKELGLSFWVDKR